MGSERLNDILIRAYTLRTRRLLNLVSTDNAVPMLSQNKATRDRDLMLDIFKILALGFLAITGLNGCEAAPPEPAPQIEAPVEVLSLIHI